ncbi:polyketide cyclase/dehydrase/lipid transport protein [Sinobacterium caligoides]|uniref:Polyketide cyclase/dehydrase/lipid transport protein n=1 Tax=Sinobacterium caligoides TaxID=933926 RepID=A0A3N2DY95_9GAMM|nr:SRPBCC domain-containing protein [Sinobacterium caligoides]ROS04798.1 polyketide cyclase/dehydrase/lipid transport protein [Sinobacterium caligoides]
MPILTLSETRIINATPTQVFQTVIGIDHYHRWNPWLKEAKGSVKPGDSVRVKVDLGRDKLEEYNHTILAYKTDKYFAWEDKGWFTFLTKGSRHRYFSLTEEGATHYRVELNLSGLFAGLAQRKFGAALSKGLAAEADALKNYCEAMTSN